MTYRGTCQQLFTDILCYQIPTKIASHQNQQSIYASFSTSDRRDSYLSVPGSANPSTKRFTSIRGDACEASREGMHETIYLPYADYLRLGYGVFPVSDRRCGGGGDSSDPQLYPRLTLVGPRPPGRAISNFHGQRRDLRDVNLNCPRFRSA